MGTVYGTIRGETAQDIALNFFTDVAADLNLWEDHGLDLAGHVYATMEELLEFSEFKNTVIQRRYPQARNERKSR